MNQAAMRITASLLLWYLLSAMSMGGGWWRSTEGLGPLTRPPLILSASGCYHHVDISLPVKYYRLACLHTSALSTRPNSSLVSLMAAMACLLFILCVCLSLSLSLRTCICFMGRFVASPPPLNVQLLLWEGSSSPIYCQYSDSLL